MRVLAVIFFTAFVATTNSSNLLEMSQTLWSKLLEGGLTKIGALDPLRVPVVKVDQSEGNTSYRIILRSLEVIGLNSSSLESVHIGRGRLHSNLSEHEAGYVSYTDQRELDTIRYRFHTVVKEPKGEESRNLDVETINGTNQYGRMRNNDSSRSGAYYQVSSRYQDNTQREVPQGPRPSSRYQQEQKNSQGIQFSYGPSKTSQDQSSRYQQEQRNPQGPQGVQFSYEPSKSHQSQSSRYQQEQRNPQEPQGIQFSYEPSKSHQDQSSRYQQDQRNSQGPQGIRFSYEPSKSHESQSSRYQQEQRNTQGPQGIRFSYEPSRSPQDQSRHNGQSQNYQRTSENVQVEYQAPQRQQSSASITSSRYSNDQENTKNPGRVRIVYAERQRDPQENSQNVNQGSTNAAPDCVASCVYRRNYANSGLRDNQRDEAQKNRNQNEDIGVAASMNFESRRAYVDVNSHRNQDGQHRFNHGNSNENRYASNYDQKTDQPNHQRQYQHYQTSSSQTRIENQPGYVDIVYADDKDQKMRRFGNLRVESGRDTTVYSLDDVLRDLRDNKRFIVHNFTEGEALTKKNDAARTASETKRIKDMVRYARDFQEMQGFYEQGMQLVYHYGDRDNEENIKVKDGMRTKRAHLDDKTEEDDIMHVIMRIRVPMLRVNAGYVLMGKVGKQVLRGNGLLNGNFTELIGDFTLELKKVDEDTMVVRAARARLSAKDKKIKLQGMDEEGPVKEILTHGLLAAEAVAAMLADDLATKALSEKTADSIIYRMYKNLPAEN